MPQFHTVRCFVMLTLIALLPSGVVLSGGLLSSKPAYAVPMGQKTSQIAPQPGCADLEGAHDFDFWIGEWDVFDSRSNQRVGKNTIFAIEDHCALEERWRGATGTSGKSLNFFNPATGKWRQVWISSGAYLVDIEGGLTAKGIMRMEGTLTTFSTQSESSFRGTWTRLANGNVRQFFELYDPKTQTWKTWFDGTYKRRIARG